MLKDGAASMRQAAAMNCLPQVLSNEINDNGKRGKQSAASAASSRKLLILLMRQAAAMVTLLRREGALAARPSEK